MNTMAAKLLRFSTHEARSAFRKGSTLVRHDFPGVGLTCIWFA